ncbi:hypothetical protein NDN08_001950 [Rhodosorus marinus]|uniref:Tetratricopeptide repeat protein n=1 Tax=Rhodosorus marinus TaxID=101924 RepID=A0AAV8UV48_9RHOD|nr:hypothetical protein NDN08_001950 [Rhodosorus marinus]
MDSFTGCGFVGPVLGVGRSLRDERRIRVRACTISGHGGTGSGFWSLSEGSRGRHLAFGIAGSVLALNLALVPPSEVFAADEIPASVKDAKEMSKKNTRITGQAASIFGAARKAAEFGDLDTALAKYDELVVAAPTFAGGFSNRANIEVVKERYEAAIADYSKSIELAPLSGDTWVVYLNRGSVYNKLQRYEEAIRDYNRALELRPEESLVLANRASIYSSRGKWDMALNDYRRAVEKKPGNVEPFWLDYALALYQRGNTQESVGILRRIVAKYPTEPLVRGALAVVLFDRGDLAEAETNWSMIDRPRTLLDKQYLEDHHWPPKSVEAMRRFKDLKE